MLVAKDLLDDYLNGNLGVVERQSSPLVTAIVVVGLKRLREWGVTG